jgi:hypothetical protein
MLNTQEEKGVRLEDKVLLLGNKRFAVVELLT